MMKRGKISTKKHTKPSQKLQITRKIYLIIRFFGYREVSRQCINSYRSSSSPFSSDPMRHLVPGAAYQLLYSTYSLTCLSQLLQTFLLRPFTFFFTFHLLSLYSFRHFFIQIYIPNVFFSVLSKFEFLYSTTFFLFVNLIIPPTHFDSCLY